MSSSMIFTVGTALRRAQDHGLPVAVLVEGHWLDGQVGGLDGDGLVLVADTGEQAIVRLGAISVVRLRAALPEDRPTRHADHEPSDTVYEAGPVVTAEAFVDEDLRTPVVIGQRRQDQAVEAQRQMLALLAE